MKCNIFVRFDVRPVCRIGLRVYRKKYDIMRYMDSVIKMIFLLEGINIWYFCCVWCLMSQSGFMCWGIVRWVKSNYSLYIFLKNATFSSNDTLWQNNHSIRKRISSVVFPKDDTENRGWKCHKKLYANVAFI